MRNHLFYLLILFAAIVGIPSCSEDLKEVESNPPQGIEDSEFLMAKENVHESIFEYARLLSIALAKNRGLNKSLEKKALQLQRKGYYEQEFYVWMEGDEEIPEFGNQSLHKLMKKVGNASTERMLEKLELTNPALTVLLIGDPKTKGFIDRVYVDDAFDDMNPKSQISYYENGVLGSHEIIEEPADKAFIVRDSEVYQDQISEISDSGRELFTNKSGIKVFVNSGAYIEITNSEGSDINYKNNNCHLTSSVECERDCVNLTENLWRFRTTNDYDGWTRGKGEWFFLMIFADEVAYTLQNGGLVITGNALDYLRTGLITDVRDNNQWHYPDFSAFFWERFGDGNRMKIACYEYDGGGTKSLSFTLNIGVKDIGGFEASGTFPINITVNDGDDRIGEYIVEYCHGISYDGFEYHPSSAVTVQHNER